MRLLPRFAPALGQLLGTLITIAAPHSHGSRAWNLTAAPDRPVMARLRPGLCGRLRRSGSLRPAATAAAGATSPPARQSDPALQRLEGQLAAIDRGRRSRPAPTRSGARGDARAASRPISTALTAQSRRQGCESAGFFSLFGGAAGPAMRAAQHADPADARQSRRMQARPAAPAGRRRTRRSSAAGDRRARAERLRPAIPARRPPSSADSSTAVRRQSRPDLAPDRLRRPRPIARSACAPATAISSRSRSRRRRTVSATTSRPASACVRPPR